MKAGLIVLEPYFFGGGSGHGLGSFSVAFVIVSSFCVSSSTDPILTAMVYGSP